YLDISPEYGTHADFKRLAKDVHGDGMHLVLDGVFNHMGRTGPKFLDAIKNPASPYRDFFFIGPEYKLGYRAWANVPNLPELRLENQAVRDYLWAKPDSVVQTYFKEGADGWRLDVAFEIGYEFLADLTQHALKAKPGSWVGGETWNYPDTWAN